MSRLEEFESWCSSGMSANLLQFRDQQDCAVTLSHLLAASQAVSQFMALSILQHQLMSRVALIPDALTRLYGIIVDTTQLHTPPTAVVFAKLLQVFASLIKRTLGGSVSTDHVSSLIDNFHPDMNISSQFLACLVGELNCRGRLGVYCVNLQFHRDAHTLFDSSGLLSKCFDRSLLSLQRALNSSEDLLPEAAHLSLRLLEELLQWEFGPLLLSAHEVRVSDLLALPAVWSALTNPALTTSIFWLLQLAIQHSSSSSSSSLSVISWTRTLEAARDTVLSFASFSGRIFPHSEAKAIFVQALLNGLNPLFDACLNSSSVNSDLLQLIGSATHKIVVNFKMSIVCKTEAFPTTLQHMYTLTLSIAKSLRSSSEQEVSNILCGSRLREDVEEVLDDWRWVALEQLLDTWATILVDTGLPIESPARSHLASSLFGEVIAALLSTVLVDSLSALGRDEAEEAEIAATVRVEALMGSACVLGRADVFTAVQTAIGVLDNTTDLMAQSRVGLSALETERLLETSRVVIAVLCKLLSDAEDDSDDISPTCDAAVIPSTVIEASIISSSIYPIPLKTAYISIIRLLTVQLQFMVASHTLYSPLLLSSSLRFIQLYLLAYEQPDSSLYAETTVESLSCFFENDDDYAVQSSSFLADILSQIIRLEGLNTALVSSICSVITIVSLKRRMLHSLSQSQSFRFVWDNLLSGSLQHSVTPEAMTSLFQALGLLSLRVNSDSSDPFEQICIAIANELDSISADISFQEMSLLIWMGKLSGLSKCAADRNGCFAGLLVYTLPKICVLTTDRAQSDVVLRCALSLLTVIVDRHLFALRPSVCIVLYRTASNLIDSASSSMTNSSSANAAMKAEDTVFKCEYLSEALHLLSNLGTKEFMLDDDDDATDIASITSFEAGVVHTLFSALFAIVPLLTLESLSAFPLAIERYLSYISFLANSYEREVLQLLCSERKEVMFLVLEHLLFCSVHAETRHAQVALSCIEAITDNVWRHLSQIDQIVLEKLFGCEGALLSWLLTCSLASDGRFGLLQDRFDNFAAALLALIRLAPQRLNDFLNAAIVALPLTYSSISVQVSQFTSNISVDLSSINKSNRRAFSQTLRGFVEDLQSQTSFIHAGLQ